MNLIAEGVDDASIHVTGNTVIDALLDMQGRIDPSSDRRAALAKQFPFVGQDGRRLILVTGHRRENFRGAASKISVLHCFASFESMT